MFEKYTDTIKYIYHIIGKVGKTVTACTPINTTYACMPFLNQMTLKNIYLISFQFINHYDTEDLMDIVLPRLAKVVTLWEFLLMKVESNQTNKPNIQNVYHEFETLTEKVKDLFKTCLKLSDNTCEVSSFNRVKVI